MGTHSLIRIYTKKRVIVQYVHYDGYYVGDAIHYDLAMLVEAGLTIEQIAEMFDELKAYDPDSEPSDEDVEACAKFTNLSVSTQSPKDWYCLLRKAQGSIIKMLASGYCEVVDNYGPQECNYALDFVAGELRAGDSEDANSGSSRPRGNAFLTFSNGAPIEKPGPDSHYLYNLEAARLVAQELAAKKTAATAAATAE